MNREGKKCVIYVRVSTEMQVDGFSLDGQRNTLKRFAEREGMIVKDIYEDAGKSGASIEGRPAFSKLLNDVKNGLAVDYILVYKLSRFGRNAADILNSLELIQSYDINLIATDEGIDSSQTSGKLLISVLSAVSEIERENIREQTMNGRKEKARQGGWNGGFAPYGYKLENGKLYINEDEAPVVRKIFEMYVTTDTGMGGIARDLNLQGEKKLKRQNGTSDIWCQTTIKRILDNPVYIGKIAFGRRSKERVKGTKNKYHMVSQKEYILGDGEHEAIIDIDTWNEAREKREKTGVANPSCVGYSRTHLLTGMLRCPKCGGTMYAQKSSYTNLYGEYYEYFRYQCTNKHRYQGTGCDYNGNILKEDIDPVVIQLVKELINDKEFAKILKEELSIKANTERLENERDNYQNKLNQVLANKEDLEYRIDNLPLDIPHRDRMLSDMSNRLYSLYDTIVELEERVKDLTLKIAGAVKNAESLDELLELLKNFDDIIEQCSEEEKKTLLSLIIKKIELYEDLSPDHSIKSIEFYFPMSLNGIDLKEIKIDEINGFKMDVDFTTNSGALLLASAKEKAIKKPTVPEKVTYRMIQSYIMERYGFKVHTAYIAEVKQKHGLRMYKAPNGKEVTKQPRKHPKPEKVVAIEDALKYYKII